MNCLLCDGDHEARDCPHYDDHDREMILLGATLLVNTQLESDYGQSLLYDFEQELVGLPEEEEDEEEDEDA